MDVLDGVIKYLAAYDGRPLKIMEVCGTHTAAAVKGGIRSLISGRIKLVSGPGCPVCLAASAYIDKLCSLAKTEGYIIVSFGDLLKVKGSGSSLLDIKAQGGRVEMVYSPLDVLKIAQENPENTIVMAAIGFETTAPIYALMLETAIEKGIGNIRLLTALKRLIPALEELCLDSSIDAFIAPGHVAAIIGSEIFAPLAEKFNKPFAIAGFTQEYMLTALYYLVRQTEKGCSGVENLYHEVVRPEGNIKALAAIDKYFEEGRAFWRGLSGIERSGFYLREGYAKFDAGSRDLNDDENESEGCLCAKVLTGRADPDKCPLFAKSCTPDNAFGPCMVSAEGACGIWYQGGISV